MVDLGSYNTRISKLGMILDMISVSLLCCVWTKDKVQTLHKALWGPEDLPAAPLSGRIICHFLPHTLGSTLAQEYLMAPLSPVSLLLGSLPGSLPLAASDSPSFPRLLASGVSALWVHTAPRPLLIKHWMHSVATISPTNVLKTGIGSLCLWIPSV
jgi:hypothetical protein